MIDDTGMGSYTFVPWMRQGIGAATSATGEVPVTVAIRDGAEATVKLRLYGPGEITGLDTRVIVRGWPLPNTPDAKAHAFPMIEFSDPDLLWRYTPNAPDGDSLPPWLTLIALKDDEFDTVQMPTDAALPAINVKSVTKSLPLLTQAWAWAHVQIVGTDSVSRDDLRSLLKRNPERMLARLLCPRKLESNTAYTAFLVPTYGRGRLAGLGQDVPALPDAKPDEGARPDEDASQRGRQDRDWAWKHGEDAPESVTLPVYYQWGFHTGDEGDFESLVRKLQPRALPDEFGTRPLEIAAPGGGIPTRPPIQHRLEGALVSPSPGRTPPKWPADGATDFPDQLRGLVNRPEDLVEGRAADRRVAPPLYGRWHAARKTLDPSGADTRRPWFHTLNADPQLRVAASLGTRIVQDKQQPLMASAWRQVEGILQANEELRAAQLAREAASTVHAREIESADDEYRILISSYVHTRILGSSTTIAHKIETSPIVEGTLQPRFRALTSPRGRIGKRQGRSENGTAAGTLLHRMNEGDLTATDPPPTPTGIRRPFWEDATVLGLAFLPNILRAFRDSLDPTPSPWDIPEIAGRFRDLLQSQTPSVALDLQTSEAFTRSLMQILARLGGEASDASTELTDALSDRLPRAGSRSGQIAETFLRLHQQLSQDSWTLDALTSEFLGEVEFALEGQAEALVRALLHRLTQLGLQQPGWEETLTDRLAHLIANQPSSIRFPDYLRYVADACNAQTGGPETDRQRAACAVLRHVMREPDPGPEYQPVDLPELSAKIARELDPKTSIPERYERRLNRPHSSTDPLDPIMKAPRFPQPMYEPLRDLSQEWLVPGLESVPANTVTVLKTNRRFVEAYMVGLNHEMARELLWREYPTDQRGSYFRQFWDDRGRIDPAGALGEDERADIAKIHEWKGNLSENARASRGDDPPGDDPTSDEKTVLLIRGELLQRYPNTIIYAVKAVRREGKRTIDDSDQRHPQFSGTLEPDVVFFGFDLTVDEMLGEDTQPQAADGEGWFIVLQEQPTELHFGLDLKRPADDKRGNTWRDLSWEDVKTSAGYITLEDQPLRNFRSDSEPKPPVHDESAWSNSSNAAKLAYITLQPPFRIAIHASDMISPS